MAMHTLIWDENAPVICTGGTIAIGNFDGVHLGHAALVRELTSQARIVKGPAVALTFDPHPLALLRPEQFQPVLTTITDRAQSLQDLGADQVVVLRTCWDLLQLTACDFFERVVKTQLKARALVEGVNFGFGRNREGTVDTLRGLCQNAGLEFTVVPPWKTEDGVVVSSSRVRSALVQGRVRDAAALLGRPYRLKGLVGTGQRRGLQLGFPTANLEQIGSLIPADGVYAVRVEQEGKMWPGAANLGPNPTFQEKARKVEVHLIGYHGDLYGKPLAIRFIDRLRDTRAFAGSGDLIRQLREDVEKARRITCPIPN